MQDTNPNPPYVVDGHMYPNDPDSDWMGDDGTMFAPFWIFDTNKQDYVGPQYDTREEAYAALEKL